MPAIKDASRRSVGGVVEDADGCLCSALWESGPALLTGVVWSKGSELVARAIDDISQRLVAAGVLAPFQHRNLNEEVATFAQVVPTSENLAAEICRRLKHDWRSAFPGEWPKLEKIRLAETPRNIFEIEADEIE